ncbi:hypothetical protein GCM10020258_34790 [Sphingomonas yabuuchiae]
MLGEGAIAPAMVEGRDGPAMPLHHALRARSPPQAQLGEEWVYRSPNLNAGRGNGLGRLAHCPTKIPATRRSMVARWPVAA